MRSALESDPELSSGFSASSAGISILSGDRAGSHSIDVMMSEWKIDISGHAASALDGKEIFDAFLILTMTGQQKEYLISRYPEAIGKTFTLKEFVKNGQAGTYHSQNHSGSLDITDPYGSPIHTYSLCAREIKEAVEKLTGIIKKSGSCFDFDKSML